MNVLHVIPTLAPQYGGPVSAVLGMTAAQTRAGVNVRLLTTDYLSNGTSVKAVCDTKVFSCLFGPWQWSPSLGRALKDEVRWADVVNIHTLWTYPVTATSRACRAAGVPYILRPAGMLDPWSLNQKRFKKRLYTSLVERETINRAAALWFTSEEERAGARLFDYQPPDCVIPLGFALDEYFDLPAVGAFRSKVLNGASGQTILYLGRITPKKQPDLVLRAFADIADDFPECLLVMAGPGDSGYRLELEKQATALGVRARVFFTGNLEKMDVVSALRDADIFVLPSLHENFGVAVIEALASGTPVIVSEGVGLAEVVTKSKAGIVIQPTREALSSSLHEILDHPDAAAAMGKRGREIALKSFTWDRIVPAITELYQNAINARSKAQD